MHVTEFTKSVLNSRRDDRRMAADGFTKTADFDWRLTRGPMQDKRITEVKVSADGKQVWYRLA